jgi:hypothetical protein
LLSFVESAPRAYRLKVGNADLFRNSTEPGTSPLGMNAELCLHSSDRSETILESCCCDVGCGSRHDQAVVDS